MIAEVSFPVRYFETDTQHVVYYANHLAWFELGYEELFAAKNQPLKETRPKVLEATCRYQAPIHYGEVVSVQSKPVRMENGHLWVAHTISANKQIRAHGTTLLAGAGQLWERALPQPIDNPEQPLDRFADWEQIAPRGHLEDIPLRVRYAETDPIRGAHFARYFGWFEVGRITFLRRIGLDYAQMETSGSPFVIAWAGCRYRSPVHFDDPMILNVWVLEVRQRGFSLGYRLMHAEEQRVVALSRSVQTFIDAAGRPTQMPKQTRELLLATADLSPGKTL